MKTARILNREDWALAVCYWHKRPLIYKKRLNYLIMT
jgi:hypothetical protein